MDFGVNKTPVGEITEGALEGTYFRSIYPSFNEKWYIKSWKEFDQLKNNDQKFYCSDYYNIIMLILIKMVLNAEHRWRFGKIKVGLMK